MWIFMGKLKNKEQEMNIVMHTHLTDEKVTRDKIKTNSSLEYRIYTLEDERDILIKSHSGKEDTIEIRRLKRTNEKGKTSI